MDLIRSVFNGSPRRMFQNPAWSSLQRQVENLGTRLEYWSFEMVALLSGLLPNPKLQTSVLSISSLNTDGAKIGHGRDGSLGGIDHRGNHDPGMMPLLAPIRYVVWIPGCSFRICRRLWVAKYMRLDQYRLTISWHFPAVLLAFKFHVGGRNQMKNDKKD
ncbi:DETOXIFICATION 10-like protein [Drosera capensis]